MTQNQKSSRPDRDPVFAMRPLEELLIDQELLRWDLAICQDSDDPPMIKESGEQFIRLQLDSIQFEIDLRRRAASRPGAPEWPSDPSEELREFWRSLKDSILIPVFWARYFPAFPLRKSGSNWRGPCPLHGGTNETSMSIYNGGRNWHCFTCGASGDVFTIAGMVYQTARFGEIAARLAEEFGIRQPEPPEPSVPIEPPKLPAPKHRPTKPRYPEFVGGRVVVP